MRFTASANIATAVEAMRRGAFDFLPKPFTPDQIRAVPAKIEKARVHEPRVRSLENQLTTEPPPVDLASAEPGTQRAIEIAFNAAPSSANRLLLGPSGTGKSILAREIHRRSPRRDAAFGTVSCPSLSRELLESELFGHVTGAFTGAVADTFGKVAAADGGTLVLDESGEMPLEIQPKLLRLLQEREYERVGEARPRRANVRVIAATNGPLADEVRAGRFREDLFHRLNVIRLALPGLRERPATALRAGGAGSRSDQLGEATALFRVLDALETLTRRDAAAAQQTAARAEQLAATTERVLLTAIVGAAALSIFVAWRLASSLLKPIQALTAAAVAVGEGDPDRPVPEFSGDELGQLARAFNTMSAKLQSYREATLAKGLRTQRPMGPR